MVTTISPHCTTNNECLHLYMKEYEIEPWCMATTKHNTCDYYMNVATVSH
jgi:hypothetical protein